MNSNGAVGTDVAIKHPNIYYFVLNASWSSTNNLEYWNKGNTVTTINNNTVYKTIYSPSPTSCSEAKPTVCTSFTTTGVNSATSSQFNVSGMFNKGWNFYCQPNFTGGTVFFSALGFRDTNSDRVNASTAGNISVLFYDGNYWTAGPSGVGSFARYYRLRSDFVNPVSESYRSFGFSMRSVSE